MAFFTVQVHRVDNNQQPYLHTIYCNTAFVSRVFIQFTGHTEATPYTVHVNVNDNVSIRVKDEGTKHFKTFEEADAFRKLITGEDVIGEATGCSGQPLLPEFIQ